MTDYQVCSTIGDMTGEHRSFHFTVADLFIDITIFAAA